MPMAFFIHIKIREGISDEKGYPHRKELLLYVQQGRRKPELRRKREAGTKVLGRE